MEEDLEERIDSYLDSVERPVPLNALADVAMAHAALEGARQIAGDMAESDGDPRLWALALAIDKAAEMIGPLKQYA